MSDRPRARRQAPRSPDPAAEPALTLALRIQSRRWRELPDLRARIDAPAAPPSRSRRRKPMDGAELSMLLTDDKRIRIVNRDWRGFDKATNVLSFPAAPVERMAQSPVLGDLVLAYETMEREAQDEGKTLGDHLSHLVIHGLLHLLGEDHETAPDAERMEALEIAALARLGIADPYADSEPLTPNQNPVPSIMSDDSRTTIRSRRAAWRIGSAISSSGWACAAAARSGRTSPRRWRRAAASSPTSARRSAPCSPMCSACARRRVGDVMVPRADIIAVPADTTLDELLALFRTAGHSRLPVFDDSLDDPRGMVHIRDFLEFIAEQGQGRPSAAGVTEAVAA